MLSHDVFLNPPNAYRPMPFWFWNSKLRLDKIEAQIRDFSAKGIGGFFIHARFGLETEYMSGEWMDCIRRAVSVAAELGMEVWLYDENGFPSGIGDLKVSRIPEYRSHFIDLTEREVAPGGTVALDLPTGEVVAAYAFASGRPQEPRIELLDCIHDGGLEWTAPDHQGDWTIAVFSKGMLEDPNDVVFGVDYLNPDAMRLFFDLTLEPYAEALGDHFGKTIQGIFTDEPTLLPWHHDIDWYGRREHTRVVVWDDRIKTEMISRVGLSAAEFLPHLFYDIDESTPELRKAFWQTVNRLYLDAFFRPYSAWCEEHNLQLTGHVLFEEGLYLNTNFQSDITELLAQFDVPGTDHLGEVTETAYGGFANTVRHLTNIQGEKLVSSVAHCNGRNTVISETYGCAGWGLSFEKMKWIADWQYSLGINMLCPHAVFYSIEGFRKSDAPPSENHMAGWKHYRGFADYIGRLSYMLRQGRHRAQIALLYPLQEFWEEHVIGKVGEADREISDSFDVCASVLPKLHWDYDILPQQVLTEAAVRNGKLLVGDEEYSVLIAAWDSFDEAALEKLSGFTRDGGVWISPPAVRGKPKDAAINLEQSLADCGIPKDIDVTTAEGAPAPDARCVTREVDGRLVHFFINTSDKPLRAVISLGRPGAVEIWDAEDGNIRPADGAQLRDGRLIVEHEFAAYGSTILVVDPSKPVQSRPAVVRTRQELMLFDTSWQFETQEPNALPLDRWELRLRTTGGGTEYYYSTVFECREAPSELALMLDDIEYRASLMGGMNMNVAVNEREWRRPEFGHYLDRGFKTLDITTAVVQGRNEIGLAIHHSAWSGQPHVLHSPAMLLGRFAVDEPSRALIVEPGRIPAGSWTAAGYPFFSGTGSYSQQFSLSSVPDGHIVACIDDVRDMMEVVVNGQSAAVRLWQPWEADVTRLLQPGVNTLTLKVTNSMLNFLESSPRDSGLMGQVRLIVEK